MCSTEFVPEHTRGVKIISKNEALRVRRRANYEDNIKLDLTKWDVMMWTGFRWLFRTVPTKVGGKLV